MLCRLYGWTSHIRGDLCVDYPFNQLSDLLHALRVLIRLADSIFLALRLIEWRLYFSVIDLWRINFLDRLLDLSRCGPGQVIIFAYWLKRLKMALARRRSTIFAGTRALVLLL